jgi:hypothetical protein
VERRRFELPTSALRTHDERDVSVDNKEVTTTPFPVCTRVCTSNPENDNAVTNSAGHQGQDKEATTKPDAASLETLAAALLTLSPADRERLAAMLKGDA